MAPEGESDDAVSAAGDTGRDGTEGEKPDAEAEPGDDTAKLRKEAAAYRHRLRESEAENQRLGRQLDEAQRAEVERLVAEPGGLQDPKDLWLAAKLDDLRDPESRAIDPERVRAELKRVIAERPHWQAPTRGFDGGARRKTHPTAPSFGEALKDPRRRRAA
jgi:hypothetical protein